MASFTPCEDAVQNSPHRQEATNLPAECVPVATPLSKKTLEYLRIEIERAEDEDDNETLVVLRDQYARLERAGTTKGAKGPVASSRQASPVSSGSSSGTASPSMDDSTRLKSSDSLSSLPCLSSGVASTPSAHSEQSTKPPRRECEGDDSAFTAPATSKDGSLEDIETTELLLEEHSNKVALVAFSLAFSIRA
jgi:hypothetical protein